MSEPGYLALHRSGELRRRADELWRLLDPCRLCPRRCGARRLSGEIGFCGVGERAVLARACRHRGEEPPLSGTRGAGTLFFAGCNLRCVYCQNHQISRGLPSGDRAGPAPQPEAWVGTLSHGALADQMLALQRMGCHNVALVTPSHVVPQIVRALEVAAGQGLCIPLVYNSSGYDRVRVLRLLEGVVDVYLPDLKYGQDGPAESLSHASDYVRQSGRAVGEMRRQVGALILDEQGLAVRGLIVRHLVLPGDLAGSREVLTFVARTLGADTHVSLMAQYRPPAELALPAPLDRPVSAAGYRRAVEVLERLGLEEGWVQEPESVDRYVPDFDDPTHPFEK